MFLAHTKKHSLVRPEMCAALGSRAMSTQEVTKKSFAIVMIARLEIGRRMTIVLVTAFDHTIHQSLHDNVNVIDNDYHLRLL